MPPHSYDEPLPPAAAIYLAQARSAVPAFRHALKAAGVPWWSIAMAGLVRWLPIILSIAAQLLPLFMSGAMAGPTYRTDRDGNAIPVDPLDDPVILPAVKDAIRAYRDGTLDAN